MLVDNILFIDNGFGLIFNFFGVPIFKLEFLSHKNQLSTNFLSFLVEDLRLIRVCFEKIEMIKPTPCPSSPQAF